MNTSRLAEDDRITVASLGALAFIVTMLLHEALGHGGMNALLGEGSVVYPQWTQSSGQSAAMVAAGPAANFIGGIAFFLFLYAYPGLSAHWRYFIWLSAAFNLFNAAGYLLLGSLSGFGDWGVLLQQWQISGPAAWALALLAAALYYAFMWLIAYTADFGRERGSRLTMIPYATAGTVACCAAAVSAQGIGMVLLAAAASFGAGFGMLVISDWNLNPAPRNTTFLLRSRPWIFVSLGASIFYIVVIGRGLAL